MIPIRDTLPSKSIPVVTYAIIILNVLLYLWEKIYTSQSNELLYYYGLVPIRYTIPKISAYFTPQEQILSFFSYMFLHGGFWHLLGNMWILYIFGDNVEDRLGHCRYVIFYLLCGIISAGTHIFINPASKVPTIGASGAIAGVMGAYFILYPRAKILTIVPIIIIPLFIEIPAFVFLGFWLMMQFVNAADIQGQVGGIAWWAHIGGFIAGIILLKVSHYIPSFGITEQLGDLTSKKKTPKLQLIKPVGIGEDPNLYGTSVISEKEAFTGTRKLIRVPIGVNKQLLNVIIPPRINNGSKLRLKGMGKQMKDKLRGDLFLKVMINF